MEGRLDPRVDDHVQLNAYIYSRRTIDNKADPLSSLT